MPLNEEQRERYARHLTLNEIGENGQKKLLQSKVLVVGAGGLGSPAAFYLAAGGIGTIGIMDGDIKWTPTGRQKVAEFKLVT